MTYNPYNNAPAQDMCMDWDSAIETDGQEFITLEEGDYNEDCYDLSGRKVLNPGKGIYIQNGKKVLFK